MDKLMKKCVKELGRNQDVNENLVKYTEMALHYNSSIAYFTLAMEYYMFYETATEKMDLYTTSAKDISKDILDEFNSIVENFFEKSPSREECQELLKRLLDIRKEVISKMHVMTAYFDCFIVYEYIFNRLQYRFDTMGSMPEDDKFIEAIANYIFSTKDNVTINENIRFIVGQIPMRLLRGKYFDIIRESVSIYKGNDVESLKGFEYMFRTNATLYKDENMDIFFTEFKQILDELRSLDYDNISEELYRTYSEKSDVSSKKLSDISDLYMQFEKLVNATYIIILAAFHGEKFAGTDVPISAMNAAKTIIRGVNSLFIEAIKGQDFNDNEEKLLLLSGFFNEIMGQQENIRDTIDVADAILDETLNAQHDAIEKLGLMEKFTALSHMSLLNSSSTFAEFNKETDNTKVTAEMADETAARLISEIKELFKGSSRMFRRAVMANTVDKMPVFFNNPQEVLDYIASSLGQCDDAAEKYASKEIIMDAIG